MVSKVNIGPYDINVHKTRFEDQDTDIFGEYKAFPSPVILIDERLSPKMEYLTIVHEIIEAICDIYDLPLDECHIRVLEMSIGQIVKENPKLVEEIIHAVQT